jgi:hypothetical protein
VTGRIKVKDEKNKTTVELTYLETGLGPGSFP